MEPSSFTESIAPNTLIHQRYLVVQVIGRGGMGAVYEAIDQRLGNRVALKQMLLSGPLFTSAFQREARILAGLRHPALPKVSDYFTDGSGQFLVMEFLPGTDLGALLAERKSPFPVDQVLHWGQQVLQTLEFLHSQSPAIIHRDIKPQNLKITPAGEIMVLDFGLAKGQVPVSASQTTAVPSVVGYTPHYAPLEQIQDGGASPLSDLYALAATLYHLATGVSPSTAPARAAALINQQPDPLPLAHMVNPAVPTAVSAWLARSLAIEARRRHPSATIMRAELSQIQASLAPAGPLNTGDTLIAPDPVPPMPSLPPAPSSARRWGALGASLAGLALIAALSALFLVLRGGLSASATPAPVEASAQVALATSEPSASSAPIASPTSAPQPSATPELATSPTGATLKPSVSLPTSAPVSVTALPALPSGPQFGPLAPQRPVRVTASGAAPAGSDSAENLITYDPANVADGQIETAWRVEGDGINAFVQLDFARPMRLASVRLLPGYAKIDRADGSDRFLQNRRVRRVRLEFSDGRSIEASFNIEDRRMQNVIFEGLQPAIVTSYVRVVILDTSAPGTNLPRDFTPISEIEVIGEELLP